MQETAYEAISQGLLKDILIDENKTVLKAKQCATDQLSRV